MLFNNVGLKLSETDAKLKHKKVLAQHTIYQLPANLNTLD